MDSSKGKEKVPAKRGATQQEEEKMKTINENIIAAIIESAHESKFVELSKAAERAGVKTMKQDDARMVCERAAHKLNDEKHLGGGWHVVLADSVQKRRTWFNALAVTCCEFD